MDDFLFPPLFIPVGKRLLHQCLHPSRKRTFVLSCAARLKDVAYMSKKRKSPESTGLGSTSGAAFASSVNRLMRPERIRH
jgi:hypothetical protein